jgi:hypothetical protein
MLSFLTREQLLASKEGADLDLQRTLEGDLELPPSGEISLLDAGAAGAFIHGLEDELFEVTYADSRP